MVVAILVLLALVTGSVALASLCPGGLQATRQGGDRSEALAVAEAGMTNSMATLNQPENRKCWFPAPR